MNPGARARMRSELCWFAATCFAVAAFLLVLVAAELNAGVGWTAHGFVAVLMAVGSSIASAVLMAVAFRIERRHEGAPETQAPPGGAGGA